MLEKKIISITPELHNTRIDKICATLFPSFTRSQWQKQGEFVLKNQKMESKTKAKEGEIWEVNLQNNKQDTHLKPWHYKLEILKESTSWVAINKPNGISVHPSASDKSQQTIVNALISQFGKDLSTEFEEIDGEKISRPGLVHRLDKDTSGILLIAKNNQTHKYLQDHWSQVTKIYYAVVQGKPSLKGQIKSGITRDIKNRQKMMVSDIENAKQAETLFWREKYNNDKNLSLLRIKILTGRTHQIRTHLSAIGFPVLGDTKYGGDTAERLFLHAAELAFPNPDNNENKCEIISTIPNQFHTFFDS